MPDSFGTELRAIHLDGIRIAETALCRDASIAPHSHQAGQICFVLEGDYLERSDSGERRLQPGMMHVRPPGRHHANSVGPDDDVLALVISIDPRRWIGQPFEGPARMLGDLADEIRAEMRRDDQAARLALDCLATLALVRLGRMSAARHEPQWLADAMSVIETRFAESLSLASIANEFRLPRGTVAAAFRRYRGTSVGEALRAARVRKAVSLLASNVPLAGIAITAGFHDQPHFTRVFRQATGLTPAEFRRRLAARS